MLLAFTHITYYSYKTVWKYILLNQMYLAICILRVRCNKYGVKLFVKAPNSANKITKTLNPHIYYNNNNNNELRKKMLP